MQSSSGDASCDLNSVQFRRCFGKGPRFNWAPDCTALLRQWIQVACKEARRKFLWLAMGSPRGGRNRAQGKRCDLFSVQFRRCFGKGPRFNWAPDCTAAAPSEADCSPSLFWMGGGLFHGGALVSISLVKAVLAGPSSPTLRRERRGSDLLAHGPCS